MQADLQRDFQLAVQYHQAGRLAEAETLYRQILARSPNQPDALHLLGVLAGQVGRSDAAVDLISRAIAINPASAEYHCNLGEIHRRCKRFDEAVACARQAIKIRPNYVTAHVNLGVALTDQHKADQAIEAFRRAIELGGNYPELFLNLGNALKQKNQLDGAIAAYHTAIALKPDHAEAHSNLAVALRDKGKLDEALDSIRRAIAIEPKYVEAHYNLGGILHEKGDLDGAIVAYQRAIALNPNHVLAHNNLGSVLMLKRQPHHAAVEFERAIQLDPALADAHFNRALALLLLGDFARGLPEYEWRGRVKPQFMFMRHGCPRPQWDGRPLDGQRIFLHAEQGFGDTLQFCRYAPLVAQRGGRIIFGCQPQLARLLQNLPGVEQIVTAPPDPVHFEFHCPLLSLPLIFRTEVASIPANIPYVSPNVALVEQWKSRIKSGEQRKIGLALAGSSANEHDQMRSMRLSQFAPLAQIPGVQFYSLQKDKASGETSPPPMSLVDFTEDFNDFADTAALIANLDLVITVDTAVAHLAGAMGKPVWVLLPYLPVWQWLLDRADSPWYPTATLFRQNTAGDWETVVDRVAEELRVNVAPRVGRE